MGGKIVRFDRLLMAGAVSLGRDVLGPARDAVLRCREASGGFRGRQGAADDWYTDFALRCLALTGADAATAARTAEWIMSRPPPGDVASLFNQLNSRRLVTALTGGRGIVAGGLPPRRVVEDLLAQGRQGAGAYTIFLAAGCLDLLGEPVPPSLVRPLTGLRTTDGGFAEQTGGTPQTCATTAALAALRFGGILDRETRASAVSFLSAQQGPDGGIRAHSSAPAGDLLSTFTTLWALTALDAMGPLDLGGLGRFVAGLRLHGGGFGAVAGDAESDPEYAYYGLASLSLLRVWADTGRGPLGAVRRWRRMAWPVRTGRSCP